MAMQLEGTVLITGGAGFIGRAIMHKAAEEHWGCDFIIYSRDELKQSLCKKTFPPSGMYRYVLGDIRDSDRLELAMLSTHTVIHAAALKYVPEAEANVSECISINVGGTQAVLQAARRAGVERVVCISTDKAVQPINTYGMTKALVERLVVENSNDLHVMAVRYGNVIGSTGSVIPSMVHDLLEGREVTMTDPEMTRFWMDYGDAVDLICAAATWHASGAVFIKPAKAMQLRVLVDTLVSLTGVKEAQVLTGRPRPGERKHERLVSEEEAPWLVTHHDDVVWLLPPWERAHITPNWEREPITSDTVGEWTQDDMKAAIKRAGRI